MGDGSLPGFERRLIGMRAGDEAEFRIPPEEGFASLRTTMSSLFLALTLTITRRSNPVCCSLLPMRRAAKCQA